MQFPALSVKVTFVQIRDLNLHNAKKTSKAQRLAEMAAQSQDQTNQNGLRIKAFNLRPELILYHLSFQFKSWSQQSIVDIPLL